MLIVEDDIAMSQLMRRLLEDLAPVSIARTLAQAREQVSRQQFALAIVDLGLPDGDGAELLPTLQRAQPGLPILVFSEHPVPAEYAGQVASLSKSGTNLDTLVATVKRLITHPGRPHAQAHASTHPAG